MAEIRDYEQRLELQKQIIEQERQRLLREHAPKLLGYLPKVRQKENKVCSESRVPSVCMPTLGSV